MDFVTPMANKLINESTSMQLSTLITKVRKAKTAAEERSIIKQESAYIRTVVGSEQLRHAKRNLVKLMYIRMLGYPAEFGQVPCLDLITKGDYSAKRVGYLGLMLLLDETNETLMMVTNSLKTDLNRFQDPYIILNALTALANICSAGMANDLAPEVERLCDAKFLSRNSIAGAIAGHVRKKALLAAVRMVTRSPDVAELFSNIPGTVIPDGNHAVVMGGVSLIQTLIASDSSGKMLKHFRSATVPGPGAEGYPALLTSVLSKLHHSKSNYEYTVSGICNPYLQVKVLKCLALLGKGSQEATDAMTDILAKVAAAHTTAQSKAGRTTRTTAGGVAMEAANTIMAIEPVPRLRSYAVQIMANFLKLSDNNMRYVALNTLQRSSATDLSAVQRHRAMIVECVKDPDSSIRRRALDLVYALVNDSNVAALSAELLAYLEVTDEAFKPSLTEHLCLLTQKFSPSTRWYVDQVLKIMVAAGGFVTDNVSHAFVVRVSNAEEAMHAYTARQSLHLASRHLDTGSPLMLGLCTWAIGEYGDLLEASQGLLEGEEAFEMEGSEDMQAAALALLEKLMRPQHSEVHAAVVMAATKLLGRFPAQHADALKAIVAGCRTAHDVEVQQRACEVGQVLLLKAALPPELIERIPPLDEATYAGNLQSDVAALAAADAANAAAGTGDLLGDLLGDTTDPVATHASPGAAAAPRSVLDDLDDLLGGSAEPAAAAAPPPFVAWRDPRDGVEITFVCTPATSPPAAAAGAPTTDILAAYSNTGAAEITGFKVLAAVPKGMTVEMKPAEGGDTLAPSGGNQVTQRMTAVNSTGGLKALAMRLKVIYTVAEEAREHLGVVNNFPAGL